MRILLAAPFAGVQGGILRWAHNIYYYYNSNHKKDIELIPFSLSRSTFININQSFIHRIIYGFKDYVKLFREFKKIIKNEKFDVIHITSSASIGLLKDLYLIYYAHLFKVKTIIHFHFGRIPELKKKNNWEWKLLKYVINKSDRVIVMDKFSYQTLINENFNNISNIPNPISPETLDLINKNKNIKVKENSILFVGHVVKTKGIYELVEACKNIHGISVKMIGYVTEEIRNTLFKAAGSDSDIWLEITGEQPFENIISEMLSCDIFILPTYTEGFPNVILESMACGCAVISTTVGAIPEMLEDDQSGKYGLLIRPQNIQELQDAINLLIVNRNLNNTIRNNAKKRVLDRYSISVIWDMLEKTWRNL